MTYSNNWSDTRPLGSAQAHTADDEIRDLRLDIHERMDELVEDWTADPVVAKQSAYGTKEGKTLIVHGSAFVIEPSEVNSFNYADSGTSSVSNVAQPMRAWVPLPNGVTITKIEWLVTNGDTAAISLVFGSLEFVQALTVEVLSSLSTTESGVGIVDSGEIGLAVGADKCYFLKADKSGGAAFGINAVRITYDTPDARNTI